MFFTSWACGRRRRRPIPEALRLNPGHGNAYNNLALAWFSLGKYQEALDCFLRADAAGVKVNPDFKRAVEAKIPPL